MPVTTCSTLSPGPADGPVVSALSTGLTPLDQLQGLSLLKARSSSAMLSLQSIVDCRSILFDSFS